MLEAAENECGDRRVYGENFAGNVGCAHAHPDSYADHNVTQDAAEKDLGKAQGNLCDSGIYHVLCEQSVRSEERRVGKECRSRWSPYH